MRAKYHKTTGDVLQLKK